jgi:hypothetical protein
VGGVQNPGHFRSSYDRQGAYRGQISRTRVTLAPLTLMEGSTWVDDGGNPARVTLVLVMWDGGGGGAPTGRMSATWVTTES